MNYSLPVPMITVLVSIYNASPVMGVSLLFSSICWAHFFWYIFVKFLHGISELYALLLWSVYTKYTKSLHVRAFSTPLNEYSCYNPPLKSTVEPSLHLKVQAFTPPH